MGSLFGNIARGIGGLAGSALRSPIARVVPGLNLLSTAYTLGSAAYDVGGALGVFGGSGGSPGNTGVAGGYPGGYSGYGMPALPFPGAGAGANYTRGGAAAAGAAVGGAAGLAAKPDLLPLTACKSYLRAPRGYVIAKDTNGAHIVARKDIARKFYGWKPAKKPLLSIRDTNAIHHAGTAIKKFEKMEKTIKHIANWHAPRHKALPPARNIIVTGKRVK